MLNYDDAVIGRRISFLALLSGIRAAMETHEISQDRLSA